MNAHKVDLLNGWHHPKNEERVRVVMLYEDLAMGRQAKELFDKVEEEFDEAMGFEFDLWRLGALRTLDLFGTIISEAAHADMIALAVRMPALSTELWRWLDVWVSKARADTALVVLFDRRYGRHHAQTVKRQLEELIGPRRITIFVESVEVEELSQPAPATKESKTSENIIPLTPVFAGSMADSAKVLALPWPRWGINE